MTTESILTSDQIIELIYRINQRYGYDFSGYSQSSFARRANRIIGLTRMPFKALADKLEKDEKFFTHFIDEIVVNVSAFFRDPIFYIAIKQDIIPILRTYPMIRIWHAGCSTGEEVYSTAILLKESGLLHKSLLYATDISQRALSAAKIGEYAVTELPEFEKNYLEAGGEKKPSDYFNLHNGKICFHDDLKHRMVFSHHNLVADQSFNEFNLILCRNVFIYFNSELQNRVLKLLLSSLTPFGYLGLGSKETVEYTGLAHHFENVNYKARIFRKKIALLQ